MTMMNKDIMTRPWWAFWRREPEKSEPGKLSKETRAKLLAAAIAETSMPGALR